MNNNKKIPTLIGVLVLVFGLAGGVVLVNKDTIFKLGASPEATPKDVRISNITDTSFSVSWVTDKQTTGLIKWGETSNLGQTVLTEAGQKNTFTHTATVRNLAKNKTYYFNVNSGGVDTSNNGIPWSTTTLSATSPDVSHVSGTIFLSTGTPATDALVYVDAPGISEQSTTTSSSGNWILALPVAESAKDTLLSVYVQAGTNGIAIAKVYLSAANPIPNITLGKTYDFLSSTLTNSTNGNSVSESLVTLPDSATNAAQQSRFDLTTTATPQPETGTVTVKSVDNGETIYTATPEFFGDGPKNTAITVTLHSSTAITQNVTVNPDGSWAWSPSATLENGSHTLTISWKDAKGILQTITKTFVVVANAQEPSFVSTPSASLTPTPKATTAPTVAPTIAASVAPTIKPTITPTITAAPTIKPTNTATPSALPTAGSPFATIAFISTGIALLIGGLYLNFSVE